MFGDIFLAFRVGGVAAFGGSRGGTPCWGIWADRAAPLQNPMPFQFVAKFNALNYIYKLLKFPTTFITTFNM